MKFFDVITKRRTVRAFETREVEDEKLAKILECINAAPSAGNMQGYDVVVVKSPKTKHTLAQASLQQSHVEQAPVVLAFFQSQDRSGARYGQRGRDLYSLQDATIACAYAQLAATALSLGTCWVGAFEEEPVARVLNAKEGFIPVAMLSIGYPAESPPPTSRRDLRDLVKWETL